MDVGIFWTTGESVLTVSAPQTLNPSCPGQSQPCHRTHVTQDRNLHTTQFLYLPDGDDESSTGP